MTGEHEMDDLEQAAAQEAEDQRRAASRRSSMRWALAIGAVVLLCGVLVAVVSNKSRPEDLYGDAKRVCQEEFIPKRLKAPSTADFADVRVEATGDLYTVTGFVDAENSFGAKIRSSFTCVVRDAGDNWLLQSATVD